MADCGGGLLACVSVFVLAVLRLTKMTERAKSDIHEGATKIPVSSF